MLVMPLITMGVTSPSLTQDERPVRGSYGNPYHLCESFPSHLTPCFSWVEKWPKQERNRFNGFPLPLKPLKRASA